MFVTRFDDGEEFGAAIGDNDDDDDDGDDIESGERGERAEGKGPGELSHKAPLAFRD